ncbi:MAG: PilZ domain-containing protein, partial [Planctomycetota bacterium]
NVSPGGWYFETATDTLRHGNLLEVELSIPPTSGLLEFGGELAGFAKVLRTNSTSGRYCVALQFCRPPKLCI